MHASRASACNLAWRMAPCARDGVPGSSLTGHSDIFALNRNMQPDSRVELQEVSAKSQEISNKKRIPGPTAGFGHPRLGIGNPLSPVSSGLPRPLAPALRRPVGAPPVRHPVRLLRASCSHSRLVCVLTALTAALRRRHGTRALPLARGISRKESTGRANRTFGWQCCVRTAAATAAWLDRHLRSGRRSPGASWGCIARRLSG